MHLLIGLRATHRLADVLRDLKAVSSGWVHDEIGARGFAWQEGYGAFTVSASQRGAVRRYIEKQAEHHRTRTFRDEYLELLRRSGVEKPDTNCTNCHELLEGRAPACRAVA